MEFKSKPGSFTPYLEYMKRDQEDTPKASALSPLSLLQLLAGQAPAALPMPALQQLSGMDPARYRDALKSLLGAGYIAIEGAALDEVVKLTDQGAKVAALARPA